ncbi:hypothetical protein Back2_26420 [Nocardioides baekrokdamisoli]|uniref:Cellulose synthase n=1 Tax=Nocardioides baekrokdamisoli TaxID=1804624 RepID=A0A3G9IQL8_9ACTN|nr:hypothetical protein [Nocardioides baekrokdamisoli]BBH18355.1 hypothetical protein Back2_26420 [Nocardioides baekrokdamisoli]
MDNAAWGALALALTTLIGVVTWSRARTRGPRTLVRGAGVALLPIAAYLTHTLRLIGRISSAIADWATGFVFSPVVWVGIVVGAVGGLMIFGARWLPGQAKAVTGAQEPKGVAATGSSSEDDELTALLRKHGIS